MEIGAQMYTLRAFCRTPEDLAASLKKVADMGYPTVQLSGTCPYDADWMKRELDKNGLRCVLTHTPAQRMREDVASVLRDHETLDCPYVGLGFWAFDEARGMSFEDYLAAWPAVARAVRAGGRRFLHHNHDRELIRLDGKPILERLAEEVPDLGFTVDTYWVQVAGGDAAWWIRRLAGRVPCVHLKDCAWDREMKALGEGNINFDGVFRAAWDAGTEYLLVEQDDCGGEDPFQCLKRSFAYLKAQGMA